MKKYIPSQVEPKWQEEWREDQIYSTDLSRAKDKYYVLVELTYPSGDLHIGHWFTFTFGDVLARFKRMQGFNVLLPNGFDAFGLPAENAAIKRGIHPQDWTLSNIERMRKQFDSMGGSFDWEKSVVTCLPEYYGWNQWVFLKMLEQDLAYRGKSLANWCPTCQTVLAHENVEAGKCWRCQSEVEQKEIPQWFFKITAYADRLIWKAPPQANWPKSLREAQNNWIGRSEGALVIFGDLEIFTTRPDTLFGAIFVVISPEHPLLDELTSAEKKVEVGEYIAKARKKSELERKESKEKTGVFTGSYVKNPLSGENIPVWVADYVLASYGTGAIMGVPAHDQRDFEFAKKYDLPIKPVILPRGEYPDKNTEENCARRAENHRKMVKELASKANKNDKKFILMGGWATCTQIGDVFREHGDIDMIILKEELDWWRGQLKDLGLELLNMFPEGMNDQYYFQATKPDIHIDVLTFEIENSEVISLTGKEPEKLGHSFDEMFDLRKIDDEPVYAMKPEFIYEWKKEHQRKTGDIRWKEQADFLMLGFEPYEGVGVLINSGEFNGLSSDRAKVDITNYFEQHQLGKKWVQYHLRDWSISRQRYWGTPIPIIHCEKCGVVPVPEKDLPVELPYTVDYTPKGKPPLATNGDWLNVKCPKCGGGGKREAETMDTFVDSSWYFFRYLDPKNKMEIFNKTLIDNWMPLEVYFGGAEHTLGHALYSRFFTLFFHDLGLIGFEEYAKERIHHGLILGSDGQKMSKSRGNVIDPDEQVKIYGADAVRTYLTFLGPIDIVAPWNPDGVYAILHFLERVWNLFDKVDEAVGLTPKNLQMMHKTIKKCTADIEKIKFNTAVASLMEWLNYLSRKDKVNRQEYETFLKLLAPFAPHMTEELWSYFAPKGASRNKQWSIHQQSWPKFDEKYLEEEEVTIAVQVNGKVRDQIVIQKDMASDGKVVEERARESSKVQKFLEGKEVKRVVYVPVKIINFVLAS